MSQTIKLFSDGADLPSLLEMAKNPLISGFTTNPTLMRKLADTKALSRKDLATASDDALELLSSWFDAGWVRSGD